MLLDCSWDIEAKDDEGARPLHYAAAEGHLQMIQLLLRRGAMVDCQSNHNTTPLHLAARERHAAAVSLLLSLGADRTIKIKFGNTAEDIATGAKGIARTAAAATDVMAGCIESEWKGSGIVL